MTVLEMCKKYYPKYWDKSRLDKLLKAKKITQEEYDEIINSLTTTK